MGMPKQTEFVLLRPRLLPLTAERRQVAVRLLTELLLVEAAKRRAGVSGSASAGVTGSGSGIVVSLPTKRGKARKAA
jgi:hypothetical protein